MPKTTTNKNPEFLEYVFKLIDGVELNEALKNGLKEINNIDLALFNRIGLKIYEKDKWTIHKILQHLIDWERIWCYRAIIFARREGTVPDAHDQELMGKNSNAEEIPLERLIDEFRVVRQSSILMFDSFNEKILKTDCEFFEYQMPLSAIGLTIAAHQIHHFKIIRERYIPLVDA